MKDDSYGLAPIKVTDSVSSPHSQRKENEMGKRLSPEEMLARVRKNLRDALYPYKENDWFLCGL